MACCSVDHLDEGTALLLDVLERRGVRTTCFVEGRHGEERPAEVQAIIERGHELGMHGWAHEEWHRLGPDCHSAITGADPARLDAFDRVVARAQDAGFEVVTAGEVAARILSEAR